MQNMYLLAYLHREVAAEQPLPIAGSYEGCATHPAIVPHEVSPTFSLGKPCCSGVIRSPQRFGAHHDLCNAGVEATASWISVSLLPDGKTALLWKAEGWEPTSVSTHTLWRPMPSGRN